METDNPVIIEQLVEATNAARSSGRSMYVYREGDYIWYSGKLPKTEIDYFYVAYPDGTFDKSEQAPEIKVGEWNDYLEQSQIRFEKLQPKFRKDKDASPKKDVARLLRVLAVHCSSIGLPSWPFCVVAGYFESRARQRNLL